MEVGGKHHAPVALPPTKTPYPLYMRVGRPQGRSGRVRKISPPPEFEPRTVQLVANRYTNCAIPAQFKRYLDVFSVPFGCLYTEAEIVYIDLIFLSHDGRRTQGFGEET